MKEDNEHIDNLFKESLEQRTFEIPDAFMTDINTRLDALPQKKRRRFLFFFFVPVLIGIGTVVSVWLFHSKNEVSQTLHSKHTAEINDQAVSQIQEEPGDHSIHSHNKQAPKTSGIDSTVEPAPLAKDQTNTHQAHQTTGSVSKHQASKTGQKTDPATTWNNKFKANTTKKHPTPKQNGGSKKGAKTKGKVKTGSGIQPASIGKTSIAGTDHIGKKAATGAVAETGKPGKNPEATSNSDTPAESTPKEETPVAAAQDSTNSADSTASAAVTETPGMEPPPTNTPKKWRYEVQFYGGIGANAIHDSKSPQFATNAQSKSILAPSFGVNGNASFHKLTFGFGLSYMQTGEKYPVETYTHWMKDSTYSEVITDTTWVFDSLQGWTPVFHDSTIYYTGQFPDSASQQNTIKNRYSWIAIPVSFGYRFEFGNYELIPRIGAQFNIGLGKNNGRYPAQNLQDLVTYPAVRFNVSYLIQLEARRNFNKWHVFVNPYFKSMISPAVSGDVIRRRYSSWGVQFGVGLKL